MLIGLGIVGSFFFVMGTLALAAPARFARALGLDVLNRDGSNEVRGIYGGYGVAMAGCCAIAFVNPALRAGIVSAVAAALFGMVAGRIWSIAVDRGAGKIMWAALFVESGLGCTLGAIALGRLQ